MSNSIAAVFKSLLAGISQRRPPTTLYHYTTASGLLGILRSKAIWATNIRFLNDSREFALAMDLTREILRERLSQAKARYQQALYSVLSDGLSHSQESQLFVASFSANGDQLSQWRGYSSEGTGYSVGFNAGILLRPHGEEGPRFLLSCIYNPKQREELLHRVVSEVVRYAEENRVYETANRDRIHAAAFKRFAGLLSLAAPIVKDQSFEEELEWRLVAPSSSFDQADPQFRSGKSSLIPFFKYRLADEGADLEIREIIIGPTPEQELAELALKSLKATQGISIGSVRASQIPYRNW
jgi:hypothetical protein